MDATRTYLDNWFFELSFKQQVMVIEGTFSFVNENGFDSGTVKIMWLTMPYNKRLEFFNLYFKKKESDSDKISLESIDMTEIPYFIDKSFLAKALNLNTKFNWNIDMLVEKFNILDDLSKRQIICNFKELL